MNKILQVASTAALLSLAVSAALGQPNTSSAALDRHVTARVLVQPRAGLSLAELDKAIQQHGGRRGASLRPINVHVVDLPPQANAMAVAQALRRNPHVKFAEVDSLLPPALFPNDPQYAYEWHLPKIGAATAWDAARGTGITIAVLDSGIDTTHPDLQSRLVAGWNFYDNNDNVTDVFGHGTAVAGIVAAAGNNGAGVTSVSFDSRIMPMRITDTSGYGYLSLMASALINAADNGARVANISFLGVSLSDTVDSAAQYMRSKGGVVIVSGGNKPELRTDPPRSSLTVVSGTDTADGWASSSWGNYIDVAAPSISIWTTKRGGGYGTVAGTSAASPVAAGIYALMMSARPDLPPATLDQILFSTAQDVGTVGYDQYFGHGRVNAAAAVAKALQAPAADAVLPTVAIAAPAGGDVTGIVPVNVNASDNIGVARVELLVNGTLTATDTIAPYGFSFDTAAYPDGALTLQARAYDAAGNAASSSTVTVTVANDKIAPMVTIQNPTAGSTVSGSVPITVSATDNQKVSKIVLTIDGKEVAVGYGSSLSYSWQAPRPKGKNATASSTISARAEDAAGNSGMRNVTVNRK